MIWKWNYQLAKYWVCYAKTSHLSFPLTLWYCGPQHLVCVKRAPFHFSLPVQEEPMGPRACFLSWPMVMERKVCLKPALGPSSSCQLLVCGFWCNKCIRDMNLESQLILKTQKHVCPMGWASPNTPQRERASAQSTSLCPAGTKQIWVRSCASPAALLPNSHFLSLTSCQDVCSVSTMCQKQWQSGPEQYLLSVSCVTRPC